MAPRKIVILNELQLKSSKQMSYIHPNGTPPEKDLHSPERCFDFVLCLNCSELDRAYTPRFENLNRRVFIGAFSFSGFLGA
jgi:hypothetical protein